MIANARPFTSSEVFFVSWARCQIVWKLESKKFPTLLQSDLIFHASFRVRVWWESMKWYQSKNSAFWGKNTIISVHFYFTTLSCSRRCDEKKREKNEEEISNKMKGGAALHRLFVLGLNFIFLFIHQQEHEQLALPEEIKNHLKNQSILRWLEEEEWKLCEVDFRLIFYVVRFDDDTVVSSASTLISLPTH